MDTLHRLLEVLPRVLIRVGDVDVVVVRAEIMVQSPQRTNNSWECHRHYSEVPIRLSHMVDSTKDSV